jgi:N-(2-amino-2-carboxyethyl)-L-glutamate synthase
MKKKSELLEEILSIRKLIGNTPLIKLKNPYCDFYAKLEYANFSGSIKDRAVNNILYYGVLNDSITAQTTIVESSSGNFALSAALHCKRLGLDFIAVVDPNINSISLKMLELFATKVVMVDEPDASGGYLLNRIRKVEDIVKSGDNYFWTNQYQNVYNYKAYAFLADEIKCNLTTIDYLFVSVSSCGTIVGLSKFLKEQFPLLKIIAVDIEGSLIFSGTKKSRHISGLGAGQRSGFLEDSTVDDAIILTHEEIIKGCNDLLDDHSIFGGGSSGACYYGALQYLKKNKVRAKATAVIICPDKGTGYLDNIFNEEWVTRILEKEMQLQTEAI